MIIVGDVLAYVADRLGFTLQSGFAGRGSIDSFYRHLNAGIAFIARKWPVLQSTQTYTTTATAGIITFPPEERILSVVEISWPSTWTEEMHEVTNQEMFEIRRRIYAGESFSSSQPKYWSYFRMQDPYIELQEAARVPDDLTIDIRYSYTRKFVPVGGTYGKSDEIDIPQDYEVLLCLYVAKSMSPRNQPELVKLLHQEFETEMNLIEEYRTRQAFNKVRRTGILRF